MWTPGRAPRTMAGTAAERYERLEKLRRERCEELKALIGELRVALVASDAEDLKDVEALCDMSSSAGVSAAIVEITSLALRDIESALERLESGSYGWCSDCGAEIPPARLRAVPSAERCRECQESADGDRMVLAA